MNLNGYTHKFTIFWKYPVDCYLKIGLVGSDDWERYPHLSIGDICFLDLTVSKQADKLRVYEVLMAMAMRIIECGGTVRDVAEILIYHQFAPYGPTSNTDIPMCDSICDYIGKYLKDKK
jgi:hypothetical protein